MTDAVKNVTAMKPGDVVDLPPLIQAEGSPPMQFKADSISSAGVVNGVLMVAGIKLVSLCVKVDEKGDLIWASR